MDPYPEHTKLHAVKDASQAQGEFIDWLADTKRIHLGGWIRYPDRSCDELTLSRQPIRKLLAEFHGINEDTLEKEKLAMLAELRKANEPK